VPTIYFSRLLQGGRHGAKSAIAHRSVGLADLILKERPLGRVSKDEATEPELRLFSPSWHFHFAPKRFMVRPGFVIGIVGLSFNIKGLGVALSLWRAV
jgi:hypothetical protein